MYNILCWYVNPNMGVTHLRSQTISQTVWHSIFLLHSIGCVHVSSLGVYREIGSRNGRVFKKHRYCTTVRSVKHGRTPLTHTFRKTHVEHKQVDIRYVDVSICVLLTIFFSFIPVVVDRHSGQSNSLPFSLTLLI